MFKDKGLNPNFHIEIPQEKSIPEGKTGLPVLDIAIKSEKEKRDLKNKLEEAEKQSITDSLTGVKNRYGLEKYINDPSHNKSSTVVAFCDIDDLHNINRKNGESIGDSVIQTVAKFLVESCYKSDSIFRKGGDEFVVVFENISDFNSFNQIISKRFDKDLMLPDAKFTFGLAQFDPKTDKSLWDTIERGSSSMATKKPSSSR